MEYCRGEPLAFNILFCSQAAAGGREPQAGDQRDQEVHLQSDHGDQPQGQDPGQPAGGPSEPLLTL